jgi:hypothetical protein
VPNLVSLAATGGRPRRLKLELHPPLAGRGTLGPSCSPGRWSGR